MSPVLFENGKADIVLLLTYYLTVSHMDTKHNHTHFSTLACPHQLDSYPTSVNQHSWILVWFCLQFFTLCVIGVDIDAEEWVTPKTTEDSDIYFLTSISDTIESFISSFHQLLYEFPIVIDLSFVTYMRTKDLYQKMATSDTLVPMT